MADAGIRAHQEWLGLIQPVGLVVAPTALVAAQFELDRSLTSKWLDYDSMLVARDDTSVLPDWPTFARVFLEWSSSQLAGAADGAALTAELSVAIPELETTLEPTYAVPDPHRSGKWLLLIKVEASGVPLDRAPTAHGAGWNASPHDQFERLLRESGVGAGLIVGDDGIGEQVIRFVYAPNGESSGWLSFPVESMTTVGGRPMLSALHELLKGWRLSRACPEARGLRRLLEDSRKYQNEVSTRLAEQVLASLYEMARGFQAADDAVASGLLHETLRVAPSEVYGGLLTTIMRLVFVLYAEERGMLPQDAAWVEHYGVGALLERLRADKARHPDTMDQRYGAWPRLLTLFRILHDGASHENIIIPSRAGELFDPDRYPFLEGRAFATRRVMGERLSSVPRVSDGTVLRVLERLLMLEEERLSYRALDVEQIGSVYEAMMGFEAQAARGSSIAVRPKTKKAGSPSHPVVNLDQLLAVPGSDRAKWLKEEADCELAAVDAAALRSATNVDTLLAALGKRISPFTPLPIRLGGLVLSPTEERRRSGSHYTPRELTEPIVAATLRPVLEAFGAAPTPEQLLDLRVCDPAMGSGAFLVGVCRYLGDRLVEAWQRANTMPAIPPDEDPQLFARRLVAQRCLYGVDRNPFAVQLAKLSLWLVTLARDHPFTFLDHALRGGDSLVGLSAHQIAAFHWDLRKPISLWGPAVAARVKDAEQRRDQIESLAETDDTPEKLRLLSEADDALQFVRLVGDAAIAAFFAEDKPKKREQRRQEYEQLVVQSLDAVLADGPLERIAEALRAEDPEIAPFHWEVEFPEVFARANAGFDAIVGNPPFLGGTRISSSLGQRYLTYLVDSTPGTTGNVDLAAFFLRRSDDLLRVGGALGLITTNSIKAGDSGRASVSLLLASRREFLAEPEERQWPGAAANVAYVPLCLQKLQAALSEVRKPNLLANNRGMCNRGCDVFGAGFVLSEQESAEIQSIDPGSGSVIQPYIGGEEFNTSPILRPNRFIINFRDLTLEEAQKYTVAFSRVERLVRPARASVQQTDRRELWWLYATRAPAIVRYLASHERVLAIAQISKHLAFAFLPKGVVFSNTLLLFLDDTYAFFSVLQSRVHFEWVMRWAGAMRQDVRYTSTDCFETFPLPADWQLSKDLERAGRECYDLRARLMFDSDEGLTALYNRFHNRDEQSAAILHLRALHDAMDRAVLDAYGWTDIQPTCEFILDHEEDDDVTSRRRKPWRYRWSDEIRDEVLARLLELNRQRALRPPASQESLF